MAWLDAPAVFAEAQRLLKPAGTLLFCTLGPDTLKQLRDAWRHADDHPHVHPFCDMHNLGDQLLAGGFVRPIVDADRITIQYPRADLLHADLRADGYTNALAARRKTLTGKTRFAAYNSALTAAQKPNQPLAITYELIYGTATAPMR